MNIIKKPVLVHVPKTGGSTLVRLPWLDYAGHATYNEARKMFGEDRLYFGVVRHPVDRFVSCMAPVFQYAQNYSLEIQGLAGGGSFQLFVKKIAERLDRLGLEYEDHVFFRQQVRQLGSIAMIIYFENFKTGIRHIADQYGEHFEEQKLNHYGKIEYERPKLDTRTIRLIESFYCFDMNRYGYESKV